MPENNVKILEADGELIKRILPALNSSHVKYVKASGSITLLALHNDKPVALLVFDIRRMSEPVDDLNEAFINIIDVDEAYRRRRIASRMIGMAASRAREQGACQLRAWSNHDRLEALAMWRRLGFCLCPTSQFWNDKEMKGFYALTRL